MNSIRLGVRCIGDRAGCIGDRAGCIGDRAGCIGDEANRKIAVETLHFDAKMCFVVVYGLNLRCTT